MRAHAAAAVRRAAGAVNVHLVLAGQADVPDPAGVLVRGRAGAVLGVGEAVVPNVVDSGGPGGGGQDGGGVGAVMGPGGVAQLVHG